MFKCLQQEVVGAVDDETLQRFCLSSVENRAWLEKQGARFEGSLCPWKTSQPTDSHYLYFSGNEKAHLYKVTAIPAPRGHRTFGPGLSKLWCDPMTSPPQVRQALGVHFQPLSRVNLICKGGRVGGVSFKTVLEADPAFRNIAVGPLAHKNSRAGRIPHAAVAETAYA
jgi:3-oxo-5alpha-steroid 4-dehydrogenase